MNASQLSSNHQLALAYALSLVVALLMAVASLAGLFFQSALYPAEELQQSFISNDVINLFIGLPILLGSMWLTRRGKLIGLLFWPGALFYVVYNYIAYAVAMPFTWLAGFGTVFFLWRIGLVVQAATGRVALARPELAVVVADLLITLAWLVGGVLLWRRQAFGYVSGAGLLFQASRCLVGCSSFSSYNHSCRQNPSRSKTSWWSSSWGWSVSSHLVFFVRGVLSKGG